MSEIDIKKLQGDSKLFAYSIDKEGKKGVLDTERELSIFNEYLASSDNKTKPKTELENIVDNINNTQKLVANFFKEKIPFNEKNVKKDIIQSISIEAQKRGVSENNIDLEYWSHIVEEFSKKYNMSHKLIISIIAQESNGKFEKNVNSSTGAGPMQITQDTTNDFYQAYRSKYVYKLMSPELFDDVMYFVDLEGNKKLKYESPSKLREACAKDDKLGIQVGILCFQAKYVEVVAKQKGLSVISTIKQLKDGSLILSPKEQKDCIQKTVELYNGSPNKKLREEYTQNVCDSLENIKFDYNNVNILSPAVDMARIKK